LNQHNPVTTKYYSARTRTKKFSHLNDSRIKRSILSAAMRLRKQDKQNLAEIICRAVLIPRGTINNYRALIIQRTTTTGKNKLQN
jgi:hypothetical protein